MKRLSALSILISITVISCGGSSAGTDSPPDVEGTWICADNCSGTCTYGTSFEVSQSGDSVSADFSGSSIEDLEGTVNNDGDFDLSSSQQDCSGNVDGDSATVDCTFTDGTNCQTATFTIE